MQTLQMSVAMSRGQLLLGVRRACVRTLVTAAETAGAPVTTDAEFQRARPFKDIPGPRPLPLVGNMWRFVPMIGDMAFRDPVEMSKYMNNRYGDIVRLEGVPGRPPYVYLFNANDVEKAYRQQGPAPIRPTLRSLTYYREKTRADWFRGRLGLFVSQGEEWAVFRRKVNPVLMQPRAATFFVEPIDQVACDFVSRMANLRDEKQEMPDDFLNELFKWGLESLALVALDVRLGCLESNLDPQSEQQRLIDAGHDNVEAIYKLDIRKSVWKYISTPTWRRFVAAQDCFYELCMKHINTAMERIKAKDAASSGDLSVLERLLISNDDPGVACIMALDMLFAGVDTTSSTASTLLYWLSKSQDAQERLYEEVSAELPRAGDGPLTAAALHRCRYLRACLRESMRLLPVSPGNSRRCVVDDLVLSNYQIPKGVDLILPHHLLSKSAEYFPRASEFRPERWLKDSDGNCEVQAAQLFASQPFGYGVRSCVGRRFAELQLHTLTARIIQRFRLELHYDVTWTTTLNLRAQTPLKFKAIDRIGAGTAT